MQSVQDDSIDSSYNDNVYDHDLKIVDWYVSFMKGWWYGFYKGMTHERKKPDSRCLSKQVHVQVQEIMHFFAYGELNEIFYLADSASSLYYDNRQYCGASGLFASVREHCS